MAAPRPPAAAAGGRGGDRPRESDGKRSLDDWVCTECKAHNFGYRPACHRCKCARVVAGVDPAAAAAWTEVLDPATRRIYWWHRGTGETTWTRPSELGPGLNATGFFGRGAADGTDKQAEYEARNNEWLKRPARQQTTVDPRNLQAAEGSNEYNIWYHRYLGEQWHTSLGKHPAPTRCYPEHDAGFTRATRHTSDIPYFCLFFARGACSRGAECAFFHHIPVAADDASLDAGHDIFGRMRHTTMRDDMRGVGSMDSSCRTLFVGGLRKTPGVELLDVVMKHFAPWGEVENVNVIHRHSVAFVRYRYRANAEFAKEAMANQACDEDEVLNVKWAHDDPNPLARAQALAADADAVLAAMVAKGATPREVVADVTGPGLVGPAPPPAGAAFPAAPCTVATWGMPHLAPTPLVGGWGWGPWAGGGEWSGGSVLPPPPPPLCAGVGGGEATRESGDGVGAKRPRHEAAEGGDQNGKRRRMQEVDTGTDGVAAVTVADAGSRDDDGGGHAAVMPGQTPAPTPTTTATQPPPGAWPAGVPGDVNSEEYRVWYTTVYLPTMAHWVGGAANGAGACGPESGGTWAGGATATAPSIDAKRAASPAK